MRRLREETRREHLCLEGQVDVERRLVSRETYRALLERMYGFQAAIEEPLLAALPPDLGLDLAKRRHVPALRRDLSYLGSDPDSLPMAAPLNILSRARALGAMYVMEGSTLGGQIISRMIRDRLGLTFETGASYYAGYGPENGPMWREFGAAADAWLARHGGADEAIAAARDTFLALDAWFQTLEG